MRKNPVFVRKIILLPIIESDMKSLFQGAMHNSVQYRHFEAVFPMIQALEDVLL